MKIRKQKGKSILIIGMGILGRHLALRMKELGNSVMVVDMKEELEQDISIEFEDYIIGDCTNENVISALGIGNFDICFVTIGKSFEASIVITSLLKSHGAKHIVTKASREIQTDVLKKIGANDVVYPERELAEKLAVRYNANNIFDFFELTGEYSIFEIAVPVDWIGKSIGTLDVRQKYNVSVLVVKNEKKLHPMPRIDYKFHPGDIIILMGKTTDVLLLTNS
ncbi:MAG: TrkA family potassium uptake protein [Treponema sp.]|nr:TrkA family potassium uptake protein [Treponema sp.]